MGDKLNKNCFPSIDASFFMIKNENIIDFNRLNFNCLKTELILKKRNKKEHGANVIPVCAHTVHIRRQPVRHIPSGMCIRPHERISIILFSTDDTVTQLTMQKLQLEMKMLTKMDQKLELEMQVLHMQQNRETKLLAARQ